MIVAHELPAGWVDTGETDRIQPSAVAGLSHVVTLEPEDVELLRGPAGADGAQGEKGDKGDAGPAGASAAGMVAFFAMAAAPAGWLIANGAMVSRETYAALFAAIGTVFGAGDGATTFKLPDLRGEFLRGLDGGRGVDVGRVLGSAQGSANLSHSHGGGVGLGGGHQHTVQASNGEGGVGGVSYAIGGGVLVNTSAIASHQHAISGDGGGEARPRNIALLPCICVG